MRIPVIRGGLVGPSRLLLLLLAPIFLSGYTFLTQQNDQGEMGTYYWNRLRMPITYIIDSGESGLPQSDKVEFVRDCFLTWEKVSSSFVAFQYDGLSAEPISVATIKDSNSKVMRIGDDIKEIIFDPDGQITEYFGLDSKTTLGVGLPIGYGFDSVELQDPQSKPYSGEIFDGFILINTSATSDESSIKSTIIHEIGHFIGLGHTTVHPFIFYDESKSDGNPNQTTIEECDLTKVPTMFAYALPDDSVGQTLEADDIAAVSSLYPACGYGQALGAISGTVKNRSGQPIFGASVMAAKYDLEKKRVDLAVSSISGYITGPSGDGEFYISGLPAGTYVLYVEPITMENMAQDCETLGLVFTQCSTRFPCEILSDLSCYENAGEVNMLEVNPGVTIEDVNIVTGQTDPAINFTRAAGAAPEVPYINGSPAGGFADCSDSGDSGDDTGDSPCGGCWLHSRPGYDAGHLAAQAALLGLLLVIFGYMFGKMRS